MIEPSAEIVPLIERLRRIDELAFLNWETFEDDLVRRMRDSAFASIQISRPLILDPRSGGANRTAAAFSKLWPYQARTDGELSERLCLSEKSNWRPFEIDRAAAVKLSGPSEVTDDEMVLALVKQEVRRRAQRDLLILMLYYPREHVMFSRKQIEGMLKAAGVDPALLSSQVILKALDLYREAGAPPIKHGDWPTVILEQSPLAGLPGLTEVERLHLLAVETSLAVVDASRAAEMPQGGINPGDPLLERLQKLEEAAVDLFIAQIMEANESQGVDQSDVSSSSAEVTSRTVPEADSRYKPIPTESEGSGCDCSEFPESVSRALFAAAADFAICADNPIKTLERNFDLLTCLSCDGGLSSGPGSDAPFERLLGFLYKALILETGRFREVDDDELRRAIGRLGGNVEDLLPCRLRLLLAEFRECGGNVYRPRRDADPLK